MPLKIAITGNIGAGKTIVSNLFKIIYNILIYNADLEAKRLMKENETIKKSLIELLSEKAFINNELNTSFIAEKIFFDENLLMKINNLVHPYVIDDFNKFISLHSKEKLIFFESALIFEKNLKKYFDKIILVYSPLKLRLKRLYKSKKINKKVIKKILHHQIPDKNKIKLADFVIYNNERKSLIQQVIQIYNILTK